MPHRAGTGQQRPDPKAPAQRSVHLVLLGLVLCAAAVGGSCFPTQSDPLYCRDSSDCKSRDPSRPICHPVDHDCRASPDGGSLCQDDPSCMDPALPNCNLSNFQCVPCVEGADNRVPSQACAHFTRPARPFCVKLGAATNCVECNEDKDCKDPANPVCQKETHACRPCAAHFECGLDNLCDNNTRCDSRVCISDGLADPNDLSDIPPRSGLGGRCAANGMGGRVIYVNSPVAGCDDMKAGTLPGSAKCNLSSAINAATTSGKSYVRILSAANTISAPFDIKTTQNSPGGRLVIVGASGDAKNPQAMSYIDGASTLINLKPVSDKVDVVLDQVELRAVQPDQTLVSCTGATLFMRGSRVRGNSALAITPTRPGVRLEDCDAVLDRNYIGMFAPEDKNANMTQLFGAHTIGLRVVESLGGHRYRLENNIIAGNKGTAVDLSAATGAQVLFRFNTVYGNGTAGKFGGGVLCPLNGTLEIQNSIVAKNWTASGNQFSDDCKWLTNLVVVGKDQAPTNMHQIAIDPVFLAKSGYSTLTPGYHLDPAVLADAASNCCIDKAIDDPQDSKDPQVTHDIDNRHRPQGPKKDIGAHEVGP